MIISNLSTVPLAYYILIIELTVFVTRWSIRLHIQTVMGAGYELVMTAMGILASEIKHAKSPEVRMQAFIVTCISCIYRHLARVYIHTAHIYIDIAHMYVSSPRVYMIGTGPHI